MKILKSLVTIVHIFLFLGLGAALIVLAFGLVSADEIMNVINNIYADPNLRLALGVTGGMLVLIGLIITNLNFGKFQMEKTIAFENPEGQVTVSLSAIEDFIKKSVHHLPEVQELRSNVTASKKGINVICKATILADTNIPETTERIQNIVKAKVQDMLGLEETINIKINVAKISSKTKGEPARKIREYDDASRRMPFGETE